MTGSVPSWHGDGPGCSLEGGLSPVASRVTSVSDSDDPHGDDTPGEEHAVDDEHTADQPDGDNDDSPRPSLLERRARAMDQVGRDAAAMSARIEAHTKGYREISERFAKAVQPALETQRLINASMPKLDTSAFTTGALFNIDGHGERLRAVDEARAIRGPQLGKAYGDWQQQLADEAAEQAREEEELAAEFAEERRRREELEAQRHDAMLSALSVTATHMEATAASVKDLVHEQRSARGAVIGTLLLAYLSVAATVLVSIWGEIGRSAQIAASGGVVLGGVLLVLLVGRGRRTRA